MRSFHHLGYSCLAALVALSLPLGEARAQECVEYAGLNHCAIGSAQLEVTEEGLKVQGGSESGEDGVAISMEGATRWTAATRLDEHTEDSAARTVFTAAAEGAPVSTATVRTEGLRSSYAATFTASGESPTYSAMVYARGVLQGAVRGLRNGTIAAVNPGGGGTTDPGPAPSCTIFSHPVCMDECSRHGWQPCFHCNVPCETSFHNHQLSTHDVPIGTCDWTISLHDPVVQLADGRIVQGDTLVLREELTGAGSYPYLNFDQITLQSTAQSTTLSNESVQTRK